RVEPDPKNAVQEVHEHEPENRVRAHHGEILLQHHAEQQVIHHVQHHPRYQPTDDHLLQVDLAHRGPRGMGERERTAEPTVGNAAGAVKPRWSPRAQRGGQGTTKRATSPPSSSAIVATRCGTTHSPSTSRLKRWVPEERSSVPSHTSSPTAVSGRGAQLFQSPAIATALAPVNRNRTTLLSPRRSGTSGASGRAARAARRGPASRLTALKNCVRGKP